MVPNARRVMAALLALALLLGPARAARAASASGEAEGEGIGRTPPRLSYTTGEVSFWRPGATDWAPAQINTPLAAGDELYTGTQGTLELQVGARAFVRAWGDTQLGLANHEPDFLQLKVTSGHVSVDVRSLEPGRTVEVDTPHAAFIIEHPGYYRADVTDQRTAFVTRRGGRATVTAPGGQAVAVAANQAVILEGAPTPTMQTYAAPELDTWDRWNYARTDQLIEGVSGRYVPPDVYGVRELDQYGSWRSAETYGSVWVPAGVPAGWVPYSTGRWIWDPFYGWTWVDTAPWGWAPYHYGRWVFVSGYWGWAPGPVVVRPVYARALVAFFGAPGIHVSIGVPVVSWVALGWGEPLVPWWGRAGFVGRPWWAGWGGPRVVNNVVINQTTVVNVNNITVYRNAGIQNAVVAVPQDRFGRHPTHEARIAQAQVDVRRLEPVRGPLQVTPAASSFVAASGHAARPPEAVLARPVVATRPHAARSDGPRVEGQGVAPDVSTPAPRIVPLPKTVQSAPAPSQTPPGSSTIERPRQSQPPRSDTTQRPDGAPATPREGERRQDASPPPPRGQVRGPEATPPAERLGNQKEANQVRGPEAPPPTEKRGPVESRREAPSLGRQETPPPPPHGQVRGADPTPPIEKPGAVEPRRETPTLSRPETPPPPPRGQVRSPEPAPVPPTEKRGAVEPRRESPSPGRPETPPPPPRGQVRGADPTPPIEKPGAVEPRRETPSPGRPETPPPPPRGQVRGPEPAPVPSAERPRNQILGPQGRTPASTAPVERPGNQMRGREASTPAPMPAPPAERRPVVQPKIQQPSASAPAAPAHSPQRIEPARPSPRPIPGGPANPPAQSRAEMRAARPAPGPVSAPQPAPAPSPPREPGQRKDKEKDRS